MTDESRGNMSKQLYKAQQIEPRGGELLKLSERLRTKELLESCITAAVRRDVPSGNASSFVFVTPHENDMELLSDTFALIIHSFLSFF